MYFRLFNANQKFKILKEEWDYLIILDACRYDYFKSEYRKYLTGSLEKVYSVASETAEWLNKVFKGRYDNVVYVSANPYVNSKGVSVKGFDARKHFYKVIDVWDWGWDKKLQTVHPREVNKAALIAAKLYPRKRLIIHYMQPHAPYLILRAEKRSSVNDSRSSNPLTSVIRSIWMAKRIFGKAVKTRLMKSLKLTPFSRGLERFMWNHKHLWREFALWPAEVAFWVGDEGLRRIYKSNLEIALRYVAKLVRKLSGHIVVTADHGELLGEYGMYGHPPGRRLPELIEVPWLEIEKV